MNCFIRPWCTREAWAHFFAGKQPHSHSNNDRAAKRQRNPLTGSSEVETEEDALSLFQAKGSSMHLCEPAGGPVLAGG